MRWPRMPRGHHRSYHPRGPHGSSRIDTGSTARPVGQPHSRLPGFEPARRAMGRASGVGNPVFYVGPATGRDGLAGAHLVAHGRDGGRLGADERDARIDAGSRECLALR